ncbi:MAG: tetratricopeptide repeat protein [Muribaculum sp.]|nr:tetratricopeptide repeat protein [Muribaculum sp.]
MQKRYTIICCIAIISCFFSSLSLTALSKAKPDESRHAKARYYYVEGSVALAEGRLAEAYELIKKASLVDPDYPEAAYNYALLRTTMRNDTIQSPHEVRRSIEMMRPFVEEYPSEAVEAMNYSFYSARSGDLDEAIRVAERTDSLVPDLTATLLQLAQYYSIKQDYDNAIKSLERYERIEGNDPDLSLRKFALMLSKGDTIALMNESKRLVAENPVNPDYMLIRGNVFEALEMPDSALICYQRAEAMDSDNGKTKLTLANFYLQQGDSVAYDLKSSEALLSDNIMLEEKLQMMTRYMQNILADSADTSRGSRLFDGLLSQYPHEPTVLDLGGQYFATIGDLQRAEELMGYATDLDPKNQDYWLRLASFYYSDEKYNESVKTCESAIEKLGQPTKGLLTVYAASATLNGEYEKCRDVNQMQLDIELPGLTLSDSPDTILMKAANADYDTLMSLARIYGMAGDSYARELDYKNAIKEYEVSLVLDPDNPMSLNNMAYFMAQDGSNLDEAEEMSRKSLVENPDNPTFLDTLAWILYLKGKYPEALEIQEKTIEIIGDNDDSMGEYWDHLGDMQYRVGQKEKALESWKKAKSLGSDNQHLSEKIRTKKIVE